MTRPAYYNEKDLKTAAWLRELIAAGEIAPGFVDTRSIEDVLPSDLDGFAQCHFFAGIGVWSYALRRAGWPDDREVWTGSCPCQPFSAAGKGDGFADERHLWPAFFHLITQRRPRVVLGEQVASKDGLAWVDLVHADLEGADYSFRAVDLCAAGVGAPHIRQRLWFVGADRLANATGRGRRVIGCALGAGDIRHADGNGQPHGLGHAERTRREGGQPGDVPGAGRGREGRLAVESGGVVAGGLALTEHGGCAGRDSPGGGAGPAVPSGGLDASSGLAGGLADDDGPGRDRQPEARVHADGRFGHDVDRRGVDGGRNGGAGGDRAPGATNGHWADCDWVFCRDGKYRPLEPGVAALARGAAARMVRLRGYGNAIVEPCARLWIETCEAEGLTC